MPGGAQCTEGGGPSESLGQRGGDADGELQKHIIGYLAFNKVTHCREESEKDLISFPTAHLESLCRAQHEHLESRDVG